MMSKQQCKLVAIVSMTIALALSLGQLELASATGEQLGSLPDLFERATILETVRMQITKHRKNHADKRYKLLHWFEREPKGVMCDNYNSLMIKTMDEYRIKAYNYLEDSKKPSSWLDGIKKMMGPLSSMKSLSRANPILREMTERHERQTKAGILTQIDVDCDLLKLHVQALDKILYVLHVDIKYLAVEPHDVINLAVYEQLVANKFVANHNFYDIVELTPRQRQLLGKFYLQHKQLEGVTVGEALEHSTPSSLIIGRLHDSCLSLMKYKQNWEEVERERADTCSHSKLDSKKAASAGRGHTEKYLEKYQGSFEFCESFLDS